MLEAFATVIVENYYFLNFQVVEASPEDDFDSIVNLDGRTNYVCRYRLTDYRTLEPMKSSAQSSPHLKIKSGCLKDVGNFSEVKVLLSPKEIQDYEETRAKSPEKSRRTNIVEDKAANSDEKNILSTRRRKSSRKSTQEVRILSESEPEDDLENMPSPAKRRSRKPSAQPAAADPKVEDEPEKQKGPATRRGRRPSEKPALGEPPSADDTQTDDKRMQVRMTSSNFVCWVELCLESVRQREPREGLQGEGSELSARRLYLGQFLFSIF